MRSTNNVDNLKYTTVVDKRLCTACTACIHVCPKKCIFMKEDREGFLYPQIVEKECLLCGLCRQVCPILNETCVNKDCFSVPFVYAVKHKDEGVRKSSSSGGVFAGLVDTIFAKDGLVAGACFDANFNVCHQIVTDKKSAERFRGAKYVQSSLGSIYCALKAELDKGELVLFSGTPCQVAGLYAFLDKRYENLFTVDLICHGVGSPRIFNDYKKYIMKQYRTDLILDLSFRNYSEAWRDSRGMRIVFEDGVYQEFYDKDYYYMLYFGRSSIIRPACHSCKFCSIHRIADITLGDFWGVEQQHPGFASHKTGCSVVLVNTKKGAWLFDKSIYSYDYIESNVSKCGQRNLMKPTVPHPHREIFWNLYCVLGFKFASMLAHVRILKAKFSSSR